MATALEDCFVHQAHATGGGNGRLSCRSTTRFTKQRDIIRIATKGLNIVRNPLQYAYKILHPEVARTDTIAK